MNNWGLSPINFTFHQIIQQAFLENRIFETGPKSALVSQNRQEKIQEGK